MSLPKDKIRDLLAVLLPLIESSLRKEEGLRFLSAGAEKTGAPSEGALKEALTRYYAYNTPLLALREALEAVLLLEDSEPRVTVSPLIFRDLERILAIADYATDALVSEPIAVTGRLTIF